MTETISFLEGGNEANPVSETNPLPVYQTSGLSIPVHDYVSCTYTGSNLTQVVYKDGGSGGTTVATLNLTYDGASNLLTVTKVLP